LHIVIYQYLYKNNKLIIKDWRGDDIEVLESPWGFVTEYLDPLNEFHKVKHFIHYVKDYALEEGEPDLPNSPDGSSSSGQLYHLHSHDPRDGITSKALEYYLLDKKGLKDKNNVPCFGCEKPLTLDDIRPIVSLKFYKEFEEGGIEKPKSDIVATVRDLGFLFLPSDRCL
jgi:hypothetical protein